MKTNPEFTKLIDQVGFGLAVVLFEKKLADYYFADLSPEQVFLIAPHVFDNERLIKLLSERLKSADCPINTWISYYNNEPDQSFLSPIILSRIESFTLSCDGWLQISVWANWRSLSDLCLEKAKAAVSDFASGKKVVAVLSAKHEPFEDLLERMSAFAVTYDEWMFIMTEAKEKSPLVGKGVAAIDKLEMTYDEWQDKGNALKNYSSIYSELYPLVMKKRQLTALTFDNFSNELGVVLLHLLFPANNSVFRSDINKLLLKMKATASTFSNWVFLANLAREHNFYSILRASLKKLEGLAVSTEDYYALYRVLRSGEKKAAYLKKLKATSPTPAFWITVISDQAKLEHRDPSILATAKEELLNAPPNSAKWLEIYVDKKSPKLLRELLLIKIAQCFYTIDRLCALYGTSQGDNELMAIVNKQIACYRVPCSGWIKLKSGFRDFCVREMLFSKILDSATTFQHWLFILNDESHLIQDCEMAKKQIALLAASLDEYLLVCENTAPDSDEYKMMLGKIDCLSLPLKEWKSVYDLAIDKQKNVEPKDDSNPLASLAIKKMTELVGVSKKNQPSLKLAE
ncbi:MAG: hypothetical protein WC467_04200 [Patescibacteria group bacterium]